jgi:hypothetical protein
MGRVTNCVVDYPLYGDEDSEGGHACGLSVGEE